MRKSDFTLPTLDDLFSTQAERDDAKLERVRNIPLAELHPFKGHPFKVQDNEEMQRMIESIRKVGAITPALARPLPYGGYELISGHRRLAACQVLGVETMPVIVRELTDDEAVIAMVDANLQRETILPSEKAFAYKMKLDAIKHQGVASAQVGQKLLSVEKVADDAGESRNQIKRYIRLTYLIPELLSMVDDGKDAHTDKKFELDKKSAMALSKLFLTPEKDLEDKKISEVLPDSFWSTNFWLYWQTMFAFQRWSSALEMKRYLCRYVHHIDGLPDFSALRFTKYNQYESMILPLVKYLEAHGVRIEYGMDVKNVIIKDDGGRKIAKQIVYIKDGKQQTIDLIEDDLVFITNGCCTDTSCYGDQTHAPDLSGVKNGFGESWDMWKAIAAQAKNGEYGNPDKFCSDVDATNWMSATVATSDDEIIRYIMNICKRDPRMGKVTTGGIVTVKDSTENWYLSWTINRQPQFKSQDKNMVLVWLYSLNTNKEGNYVKKAMRDCTGEEICCEWLYHIGVPTEKINALAKNSCNTTTCYMPYINAFFQPRKESDRPKVVPDGAVNFAFIGQFAETPRDTIFTTEYSMRTGMESVYTLLDIDRGVPEVWGSKYDVRELLRACYYAIDKKPITDIKLSFKEKMLLKVVMKKAKGTDVELLLKESGLIE